MVSSSTTNPLEGEVFVARKMTHAAGSIKLGLQDRRYLENLEAKKKCGSVGDFVETMWLILQRDRPDDYAIAPGDTHSASEFTEKVFQKLDLG